MAGRMIVAVGEDLQGGPTRARRPRYASITAGSLRARPRCLRGRWSTLETSARSARASTRRPSARQEVVAPCSRSGGIGREDLANEERHQTQGGLVEEHDTLSGHEPAGHREHCCWPPDSAAAGGGASATRAGRGRRGVEVQRARRGCRGRSRGRGRPARDCRAARSPKHRAPRGRGRCRGGPPTTRAAPDVTAIEGDAPRSGTKNTRDGLEQRLARASCRRSQLVGIRCAPRW